PLRAETPLDLARHGMRQALVQAGKAALGFNAGGSRAPGLRLLGRRCLGFGLSGLVRLLRSGLLFLHVVLGLLADPARLLGGTRALLFAAGLFGSGAFGLFARASLGFGLQGGLAPRLGPCDLGIQLLDQVAQPRIPRLKLLGVAALLVQPGANLFQHLAALRLLVLQVFAALADVGPHRIEFPAAVVGLLPQPGQAVQRGPQGIERL